LFLSTPGTKKPSCATGYQPVLGNPKVHESYSKVPKIHEI